MRYLEALLPVHCFPPPEFYGATFTDLREINLKADKHLLGGWCWTGSEVQSKVESLPSIHTHPDTHATCCLRLQSHPSVTLTILSISEIRSHSPLTPPFPNMSGGRQTMVGWVWHRASNYGYIMARERFTTLKDKNKTTRWYNNTVTSNINQYKEKKDNK